MGHILAGLNTQWAVKCFKIRGKMLMIELRWNVTRHNNGIPNMVLQYRTKIGTTIDKDLYRADIWSDWQDVPIVDISNE